MNVEHALTPGNATVMTDSTMTALMKEMAAAMPALDLKASQLVAVLNNSYTWRNGRNKQQAMKLLRALMTASRHELYYQIEHYKEQLLDVLAQDEAAKLLALREQQLGYSGLTFCVPDDEPIPDYFFRVPIQSPVAKLVSALTAEPYEYEWELLKLNDFPNRIPAEAMLAIEVLDQHQITPQAYWVADKVRVIHYERRSVDPVLVVQFRRRFIGIAEWI